MKSKLTFKEQIKMVWTCDEDERIILEKMLQTQMGEKRPKPDGFIKLGRI